MTGVEYLCGPRKIFYLYMFIYTIKRRRKKTFLFCHIRCRVKDAWEDLIYHTVEFMAAAMRLYNYNTYLRNYN